MAASEGQRLAAPAIMLRAPSEPAPHVAGICPWRTSVDRLLRNHTSVSFLMLQRRGAVGTAVDGPSNHAEPRYPPGAKLVASITALMSPWARQVGP